MRALLPSAAFIHGAGMGLFSDRCDPLDVTDPTPTPLPTAPVASPGGALPERARPFGNPNFRRLWTGAVTSSAGTAVGTIIITWLVYNQTHSPLAISLLGILQFLPTLAFGLLAGALIDRWDRRRLMVACDLARAATFAVLAGYVLVAGVSSVLLLVAVLVVASFSTVFRPATNATIPRILSADQTTEGNGLLQGGSTIASFVGSPLGGLFLAANLAVVGLAVNSLTFAVSGILILAMVFPAARAAAASKEPGASLLAEVRAGVRYLASQRALLVITLTAMAANFFLSIWGGFTVVYVSERLREGATGFGLIVAATTAGFAAGALLPGRLHTERAAGLWTTLAWGAAGFFLIALGLTHSLLVALVAEFGAGACLSLGNTTWLSGVQRTVPDEYLGRYFATDEAGSFAMIPAGLAAGGLIVLYVGVGWTYILAGLGVVVCNLVLLTSAEVRRWGRSGTPAPRHDPPTGA